MEGWTVDWLHWLLAGIALLLLELLTPGALFLMFFGASAIVVGVLSAAGMAGPLSMQIILFAALSLVALLSLRRMLLAKLNLVGPGKAVDSLVGETALALEDLAVDSVGKAELRGSAWNALNVGGTTLSTGKRCTVVKVDGLTLWVHD